MAYPKKSFTRWLVYVMTETGYIIKFFNTKDEAEQYKQEHGL